MAQVPFADGTGIVAFGLEEFGKQYFVFVDPIFTRRGKRPMDPDTVGIAARQ
jgi:hypothetical protein